MQVSWGDITVELTEGKVEMVPVYDDNGNLLFRHFTLTGVLAPDKLAPDKEE